VKEFLSLTERSKEEKRQTHNSKNESNLYTAIMSSRNAAPSDLKDPEVTQQNLPKGETWDENE